MSIKTFNQSQIRQIEDIGVQNTVRTLWQWKAKEGIKIVQRAINTLGKNLKIDGWLGDKSIAALNHVNSVKMNGALLNQLSILSESKDPHYITIARNELGVKEIVGKKHNKRVIKYHATSSGKYKNDEVPWCGSFVNWVMTEAGYTKTVKYPERAKAWKKFGKSVSKPTLGSIAVKSRSGGGHVAFVIGESKGGKYLYCLGGNQDNAVSIRKYKKDVFTDFRIPNNTKPVALAVYTGNAHNAGKET